MPNKDRKKKNTRYCECCGKALHNPKDSKLTATQHIICYRKNMALIKEGKEPYPILFSVKTGDTINEITSKKYARLRYPGVYPLPQNRKEEPPEPKAHVESPKRIKRSLIKPVDKTKPFDDKVIIDIHYGVAPSNAR